MRAIILISLMILSCYNSDISDKSNINCSLPTPGFNNFHSSAFLNRPSSIDGEHNNTIKISKSGDIFFNGEKLSKSGDSGEIELVAIINRTKLLPIQILTALDFDAGAPCTKINVVRGLMEKHLNCSSSDICFQGSYFADHR